jgi:hypothetical protein
MSMIDVEIEVDGPEYLTIKQVSHVTRISVPTLRRYIRDYKRCLEIKRGPKNKALFSRVMIEQVIAISHLVRSGRSRDEVIKSLAVKEQDRVGGGGELTQTSVNKRHNAVSREIHSLITAVKKMQSQINLYQDDRDVVGDTHDKILKLNEELEKEREKNSDLENRLKKQEESLDVVCEWIEGQSFWRSVKKIFGLGKKK